MKRIIICTICLLISEVVFSDTISDYYMLRKGSIQEYLTYKVSTNKILLEETVSIKDSYTDKSTGMKLVQVEQKNKYATTRELLGVDDNHVWLLMRIDGFGKEIKYDKPVIKTQINGSWKDLTLYPKEYYEYSSRRASCRVGDKTYADCIEVEKQIYLDSSLYGIEKSYYARGLGLIKTQYFTHEYQEKDRITVLMNY